MNLHGIGSFWWFINAFNVEMKTPAELTAGVFLKHPRFWGAQTLWALSGHVMSFWKASCFQQYRNQTGSPANQSPTSPVSNQGFSPGGSPQVRAESPLTMFACCAFGRSSLSQLSVLPPTLFSVCISTLCLSLWFCRDFYPCCLYILYCNCLGKMAGQVC